MRKTSRMEDKDWAAVAVLVVWLLAFLLGG